MNPIKECKQDLERLKDFDQRVARLIKEVSEHGAVFQSRYQQSDDEQLAIVGELYTGLCVELKELRKNTNQHSRISSELNSRLKRLKSLRPNLFQRLFLRKRIRAARSLA